MYAKYTNSYNCVPLKLQHMHKDSKKVTLLPNYVESNNFPPLQVLVVLIIAGIAIYFFLSQEGEIWPNSQAEINIIFKPQEAQRYEHFNNVC